jgi:hypothetical protein
VKDTAIEKREPAALKERAQYALAFGVIALMLYVAGFPLFLLFFVGVLTFFIWKVFSSERRNETRRIFEFYLCANEILRNDDRRWYGFEVQDAIARGESIVKVMLSAPPLVHFALGALYQKIDDHSSAIKHLAPIVESSDESNVFFPTDELRDYVRVLRKIERAPAEAPMTSSAIRALERARRNRAGALLDASRAKIGDATPQLQDAQSADEIRLKSESVVDIAHCSDDENEVQINDDPRAASASNIDRIQEKENTSRRHRAKTSSHKERKTISEVLHEIYDAKIG